MRSNELRIGNIFLFQGATGRLFGVNKDCFIQYSQCSDVYNCGIDEIEQIPLTEEILLKCGFEKVREYFTIDNEFEVFKDNKGYYTHINCGNIYLKSIHQLQNLYFYLIGEELEINF